MRTIPLGVTTVLVVSALALSCDHRGQPLEPPAPPLADISDAVNNGGNPSFYFLPPLVADPMASGTYDGSLSPEVRICALSGSDCTQTIATLTATAGSGATPDEEHYIANWHTDEYSLASDRTYRIEVLVAGTRLGFADVQVADSKEEAKNLKTGQTFALKDGRTLPIKFRIEEGAVFVVGAGGATVTAEDGAVTLGFPEGALEEPVGITVRAATDYAVAPYAPVAGTVYQFGPDGSTFAEPVTLTIRYSETAISEGVGEGDLGIRKLVDDEWVPVPGSTVDEDGNTVSVVIDGFSTYAVVQLPGPTLRNLSQIVFVSDRDGDYEIYMMYSDGSGVVQLTDNTASDITPAVSPDGSRIAFASDRDGDLDIYVMQADGSGVTNVTDSYQGPDFSPAWSPDGNFLVFSSGRGGYFQLWMTRSLDWAGPVQVTRAAANDAGTSWADVVLGDLAWTIFFHRDRGNGDYDIFGVVVHAYCLCAGVLQPPTGVSATRSLGTEVNPEWSSDHRGLLFSSDRTGNREIMLFTPVTTVYGNGTLTNLTNNPAFDANPTWHPAGTHIAFERYPDAITNVGDICIMDADGSGQTCIANPADDRMPAWRVVGQ